MKSFRVTPDSTVNYTGTIRIVILKYASQTEFVDDDPFIDKKQMVA